MKTNNSISENIQLKSRVSTLEELLKEYEQTVIKQENRLENRVEELKNNIIEFNIEQESLKRSEEVYRSLFENMLNGFAYCEMIYDDQNKPQDFVYLKINPAFEKLTGLKDVVGKKVTQVIPGIKQSDPELFEIYGRVALTGRSETLETYLKSLDMWFSISVYSSQRGYFVAVFDVITERKKAEEALRKSEERYRSIFNNFVDLYYRTDMNGIIVDVSPSCFVLSGWRSDELIGHPVVDVYLDPLERKGFLDKLLRDGRVYDYEIVLLKKDGGHLATSVSSSLVKNEQGVPVYIEGIIRDISDRKLLEEKTNQIIKYNPIATFIIDKDGVVTHWNRVCEVLTGVPADAIIGTKNTWMAFYEDKRPVMAELVLRDKPEEEMKKYYSSLSPRPVFLGVYEASSYLDKIKKWINFTASPILDSFGHIIGVLETLQDITKIKKSEEDFKNKNQELQKINSFMINRELKMIELKKEIGELKERAQGKKVN